jgi:hypothetical protein
MKLKPYHPLSQGLVMSLLFNENGGSIVHDATGNQNHGTGTNIVWGEDGLDLPGSNEHIIVPNFIDQEADWTIVPNFIDQEADWTIFTSFVHKVRNPTAQVEDSVMVSMKDGTGTGESLLYIDDEGATPSYKLRSHIEGAVNEATTVIDLNTEYTAGLTQSGTAFNFYLNGQNDGSFNITPHAANGDIVLFDRNSAVGDGCFAGSAKVFHWYDRPLSAAEMMWLDYDAFSMFEPDFTPHHYVVPILPGGGYVLPAPSHPHIKPRWVASVGVMEGILTYNCRKHGFPHPILAMPFWEGAGNIAFDYSGHQHHGTLNGPAWVFDGVYFDGINDNINLGEGNGLFDFGTGDFSIFTAIKRNAVSSAYETVLGKWVSGYPVQYWIRIGEDNKLFGGHRTEAEGRWYIKSSVAIADTDTHNILYQRNSGISNYQFFIDGVDVTVNDQQQIAYNTTTDNDADVILGSNGVTAEYFNGDFYNTIVFDTYLTSAQSKFLHYDPYFMYRLPEELYGSASAAPIPVIIQHLRQQGIL